MRKIRSILYGSGIVLVLSAPAFAGPPVLSVSWHVSSLLDAAWWILFWLRL